MTDQKKVAAVVLAAGDGKRLKSETPKVLHRVAGRSLLGHVLAALEPLNLAATTIVVSDRTEEFEKALSEEGLGSDTSLVVQSPPKGTADAVRVALESLPADLDAVLVVPGDGPLLTSETLSALLQSHDGGASMLTATLENPAGYGRIVRSSDGGVDRIVEDKDASDEERAVHEVNAGVYVFDLAALSKLLPKVDRENAQSEYYVTDVVGLLRSEGEPVAATEADPDEVVGVNSRADLANVASLIRRRVNERWMAEGVTIVDPNTTYIDASVVIDGDATVLPFTFIEGASTVGTGAVVGPQSRIVDSKVGPGASVTFAVVRDSEIGPNASVGPYASLRGGTVLEAGARIGTFVEAKKTRLGADSKANHLTYLGDAKIGRDVNVGAGVVTCNWDGKEKHETIIEDDAYIGSDTMLVAPAHVGKRAATGAGSVVKGKVPDDALAVGVPAKILPGKGNKMGRPVKNSGTEPEEPRQ